MLGRFGSVCHVFVDGDFGKACVGPRLSGPIRDCVFVVGSGLVRIWEADGLNAGARRYVPTLVMPGEAVYETTGYKVSCVHVDKCSKSLSIGLDKQLIKLYTTLVLIQPFLKHKSQN